MKYIIANKLEDDKVLGYIAGVLSISNILDGSSIGCKVKLADGFSFYLTGSTGQHATHKLWRFMQSNESCFNIEQVVKPSDITWVDAEGNIVE